VFAQTDMEYQLAAVVAVAAAAGDNTFAAGISAVADTIAFYDLDHRFEIADLETF
jgi:hypothetical protein